MSTVLSTDPASISSCVTGIDVQVKLKVSAGEIKLFASISPATKFGELTHLGSLSTMFPMLTLPVLLTVNVYSNVSPAESGKSGVDLTISQAAVCANGVIVGSSLSAAEPDTSSTSSPAGSCPSAVALFCTKPASISFCCIA